MTTINHTPSHPEPRPLAPRELEYLRGVAAGQTRKEIAKAMGVSPETVKGAMGRIYFKLGAHRCAEAVYKATQAGMLCLMMMLTTASLFSGEDFARIRPPRRPGQTQVARPNRKED